MTDASATRSWVSVSRSALSLGLLALMGTALLTWVHEVTEPKIEEQKRKQLLLQLQQVVPAQGFDNAMHQDFITVRDELAFPGGQEVRVYRARLGGQPAAVVMRLRANDGYHGRIDLLVGIYTQGQISGVRVLSHSETPGLGDAIEIERSNWIRSFDGRTLNDPTDAGWAVKRDGGEFDQFTGATITPRAVVAAVHRALQYFDAQSQTLFSNPSEFRTQDDGGNQ